MNQFDMGYRKGIWIGVSKALTGVTGERSFFIFLHCESISSMYSANLVI